MLNDTNKIKETLSHKYQKSFKLKKRKKFIKLKFSFLLKILGLKLDKKYKSLIKKKFDNKRFKNCINNENDTQIRCLILNSNNNFKKSSEIIVSRISTNNYKIVNKLNKHQNFVLPFLYDNFINNKFYYNNDCA